MPIDPHWFVKEFERGDKISESQNRTDCLGLILSGSAFVISEGQSSVSVLRCGAEFGICNIFISERMPTVLTAKTRCSAAFIPKDVFAELLSQSRVLMYRYVKLCNEKMVYLAGRLRLLSIPSCEGRLLYWLEENACDSRVKLNISKEELAKRLGMSRASLFRSAASLENAGIISSSGSIIILNKQKTAP